MRYQYIYNRDPQRARGLIKYDTESGHYTGRYGRGCLAKLDVCFQAPDNINASRIKRTIFDNVVVTDAFTSCMSRNQEMIQRHVLSSAIV